MHLQAPRQLLVGALPLVASVVATAARAASAVASVAATQLTAVVDSSWMTTTLTVKAQRLRWV